MDKLPVLYSFRRCPYAMRARLAILSSGVVCEIREVLLSDKPPEMIKISSKGTVPVLEVRDGKVIDESLDIMMWAFQKNDPDNILNDYSDCKEQSDGLIETIDGPFKYHLDRYKYASQFDESDPIKHRDMALDLLGVINSKINDNFFLFGNQFSFSDMALLPFVRQFRIADPNWFDNDMPFKKIKNWLKKFLDSDSFSKIMIKYPQWRNGGESILFPDHNTL